LKIYKFTIPTTKWVRDADDPSLEYRGCVAACIADDKNHAIELLTHYAATFGFDSRWLKVATVTEIPIINGATIAWAQV